jgi:hypothetical protein
MKRCQVILQTRGGKREVTEMNVASKGARAKWILSLNLQVREGMLRDPKTAAHYFVWQH